MEWNLPIEIHLPDDHATDMGIHALRVNGVSTWAILYIEIIKGGSYKEGR
jgi:hypothetical protein